MRWPFASRRLLTGAGGVPALSQATDKIPTYVVGLDARLSGGIPRGHIVLVGGPPGSLKSSFVYRILFHEAKERAASGLYLSMEQSRASLVAQMTSLGMEPSQAKGVHVIDVRALRGVEHDLDYFPLLVEHGTFEIVSE